MLVSGELDVAILPTSDVPCFGRRLTILQAGCLAAAGPALIARVFSKVRAEDLTILWADSHSRSVIVLVQVLWASLYRRQLSVIPFDPDREQPPSDAEAVLLIGDRVVAKPPMGFYRQFDPSAMWFEMTGLPFVFAVWAMMRKDGREPLCRILRLARQRGQEHVEQIAMEFAPAYGWPIDLALRCLTRELQFEFTDAHRQGLEEFLDLAAEYKLIDLPSPLQYQAPRRSV